MRFLFTRRWLGFFAVIALMGYACLLLGQWQFSRLEDRRERNAIAAQNLDAEPAPIAEVFDVDEALPRESEWRRVSGLGRYLGEDSIVLRYQTRDGIAGVELVTPFELKSGERVLVDRGWFRTENAGRRPAELPNPPAPAGDNVYVEGYARANATGDSTKVSDGSARAISSRAVSEQVGYPLLQGFVDLAEERPAAQTPLVLPERPDLGEGPHFFYGLQWWFFGALALGGFGYFAYDERRRARRPEDDDAPVGVGSEAAQRSAVDGND